MNVNYTTSRPETSAVDAATVRSSSGIGGDTTQAFLTLLMAQLKTQDPLSPMDPNQMVTQLVQFNSLAQLMSIRQLLEQQTPAAQSATAAVTAAGGK